MVHGIVRTESQEVRIVASKSNPDLELLSISMDIMENVHAALSHSSNFDELKLSACDFSDPAVFEALLNVIQHCKCPKVVDLSSAKFSGKPEFSRLLSAFQTNNTVVDLNLCGYLCSDYVSNDGSLLRFFQHNKHLRKLNLSGHSLSQEVAQDLAQGLQHNSTLKELVLHSCFLDDVTAALVLESASELSVLDLGANIRCTPRFLRTALANYLRTNKNLRKLILDHSSAMFAVHNAAELNPFWKALENNVTLQSLSLRYCHLKKSIGEAVLKTLTVNEHLLSLNLEFSGFALRDDGSKILVRLLPQFRGLRELKLFANYPPHTVPQLVAAVKQNSSLHIFNPRLGFTHPEEHRHIQETLERNFRLAQAQILLEIAEIPMALLPPALSHLNANKLLWVGCILPGLATMDRSLSIKTTY